MASTNRRLSVEKLKIDVADIIQCSICINRPRDPRSLPCLHTYCLHCLTVFHERSVLSRIIDPDRIRCPECNTISDIPPGGLDRLPTDFRIHQLEAIFDDEFTIKDVPPSPSSRSPRSPVTPLSASPTGNVFFRQSTVPIAEKMHKLINENPREAKTYIKSLGDREKKRASGKLIEGRSALCVACAVKSYDLMIYLIEECKANVNQIIVGTSHEGKQVESSILIQAVARGDRTAAQVLIGRGAKVNQADGEGITPLFVACIEGCMDLVEYLVDLSADVNNSVNKYGVSPLLLASSRGYLNVLKCLIDHGADVNAVQKDGKSALMVACEKSPEEDMTVAFLLTQCAAPNLRDEQGRTAVIYATRRPSVDALTILLMNGAHINIQDADGQTALHHAIIVRSLEAIDVLMNHGADPNVKDQHGVTSFTLAGLSKEIIKMLKTFKKQKRRK